MDYSPLDQPEIARTLFYPERLWFPTPPDAQDHRIPVAAGVRVSARFYPRDLKAPTVLLFHGNAEVACQYDPLARSYHHAGANLFVADYRGYGLSDGIPTIASMMDDAGCVYEYAARALESAGYAGPRFVMGRSLGSQSAIIVAAAFPGELNGMIIEGGFAGIERLLSRFTSGPLPAAVLGVIQAHKATLSSIRMPLFVIHGENDEVVPAEEGIALYVAVSSPDKELLLVPNAGHNDLLSVAPSKYFGTLKKFLSEHGGTFG